MDGFGWHLAAPAHAQPASRRRGTPQISPYCSAQRAEASAAELRCVMDRVETEPVASLNENQDSLPRNLKRSVLTSPVQEKCSSVNVLIQ